MRCGAHTDTYIHKNIYEYHARIYVYDVYAALVRQAYVTDTITVSVCLFLLSLLLLLLLAVGGGASVESGCSPSFTAPLRPRLCTQRVLGRNKVGDK